MTNNGPPHNEEMTMATHIHPLEGCRPEPLASYLKALGILRLVAEQADPDAAGWWDDDVFHLRTTLNEEALLRFFLHDYRPTPIVSPWNGGSGFYPKDNSSALDAIGKSKSSRFQPYKEAIAVCRTVVHGLESSPKESEKLDLLKQLRGTLPDESVLWLDAAWVIGDAAKAAPVLGTGGNDGRLDFSNNFMQRLTECLIGQQGALQASLLRSALFMEPESSLTPKKIGQFSPPDAGGPNGTTGLSSKDAAPLNSWDFILNFEGALLLVGAMTRRLGASGGSNLSFPFTVRPSSVAYSTEADSDSSSTRAESWMPLWSRPTRLSELSHVFAEARSDRDGKPARTGLDFARAIKSLGVDRGISAFSRISFMVRNGLSYLAVPLGRINVGYTPEVRILAELDRWMEWSRSTVRGDKAPASLRRAYSRLEGALFKVCEQATPVNFADLLIALGTVEHHVIRSRELRKAIRPIAGLSLRWVRLANDDSVEFRLARVLASMDLRPWLEPVPLNARPWGFEEEADSRVVWAERSLERNLHALFGRLLLDIQRDNIPRGVLGGSDHFASPDDLAAFLDGQTDDDRLAGLLLGLSLLKWPGRKDSGFNPRPASARPLPAEYAILKLAHLHCHPARGDGLAPLPIPPGVYRLASGGRDDAIALALQRLRASGLPPRVGAFRVPPGRLRRAAAALLFPLHPQHLDALLRSVMVPDDKPGPTEPNHDDEPAQHAQAGA